MTEAEVNKLRCILDKVMFEAVKVGCKFGPIYASMHEAFGVMQEEFDEFWEHVKVNQKKRDLDAMREELIQIASCAVRAAYSIDVGRGR